MSSVEVLLDQIKQALQSANPKQACQLAEQARALDSADPRLVLLHGVALRRSDRPTEAIPLLEQMVEEAPTLALARQELALGYQSVGRLRDAVMALETLVEQDPSLKSAWRDLYHARAAEGDDAGAAEAYRQSLDANGLDPLLQRALGFMESGRLGMAEGICREYLKHHPHDVDAMRLLAEVGTTLGILDEALLLLERCLELAPNFTVAQANYATALARSQRFDEALANTEALQRDEPNRVSHKVQHAAVLSMAGRYPEAHDKFEEVLAIIPDNAKILTNYGHSLRYGGKGSEAVAAYERAITADPSAGEAYWSLANLKTFNFSDDKLAAMQATYQATQKLGPDRYHLAFAVGKALEDRAEHEAAFNAYADGNGIKRQFSSYTVERTTKQVDNMIEYCQPALFDGKGHPSDAPIFVLGLPRAGSTLLEQILASHSQVEATAELPLIGMLAAEMSGAKRLSEQERYPHNLGSLSNDERFELGQRYLEGAERYRTGKAHFVDKMPNNWMHIALIKMILPNAKIIDARRHPLAACFANFKQLFARGQEFTYGLDEIGHYYADYVRLIKHLDGVMPGEILTVQYETVVDDLETQVRSILAHCGLEFEAQCLRYYEKERSVRTASSEQVRQPIYRDAVDTWQHYEHHLAPLKALFDEKGIAY